MSVHANPTTPPSTSGGETTTAETTTSPLETKSAAITGNTAIRLLESYSKKELGLDNVGKKKYEFMLSTIGSEIKGKKYIRAEAGYMDQTGKDENGKPVYQMKSYKTFYIAYDGKTLLIDQGDGKYKTLQIDKARLDQVTTTQASTQIVSTEPNGSGASANAARVSPS